MAKKTIQDLRLEDEVYWVSTSGTVQSTRVSTLGVDEIRLSNTRVYKREIGDKTCFLFKDSHYKFVHYLSKVDALNAALKVHEEALRKHYEEVHKALESISNTSERIREIDRLIAEELRNQ